MRILMLSNLYPPNVVGGYERLCFDVTVGLAGLGHEMIVLTSRYGGEVADYSKQRVFRELDLLTGPNIYSPFLGTAEERDAINHSNLATLQRTLVTERPDVVFSWNLFFLDVSMLQALESSGIRTVVMLTDNWLLVMRNPIFVRDYFQDVVHSNKPFHPPTQPSLWQGMRQRLRNLTSSGQRTGRGLDAIFGAAFVRDLYAAGGSEFPVHRVIHNGVRQTGYAEATAPDRTRLVQPGILNLLFAGRLVDLKGAHTAVAALSLLDPAAVGVNEIRLTLVGDVQDTAYKEQLDVAIAGSARGGNIILRPAVPEDQLAALFNEYDIYIFPSLYEPFSLTLIHALALGIPTIASRVGGNVEIVQDGESGLLFNKGDAADLAGAVTRLAQDGSMRARIAEGGRRSAARFTFERMIREMMDFLGGSR